MRIFIREVYFVLSFVYDQDVTASEIRELLHLEPHPVEGGYFRRTYTSRIKVNLERRTRAASTAIYYLLEPETFSAMHVLANDEIFHFYLGDPVEMLQLYPDGRSEVTILGHDLAHGQCVQHLVPAGTCQGSRLLDGGRVALLGCTVTPGFDYADYTSGTYAELSKERPSESDRIRALTRS